MQPIPADWRGRPELERALRILVEGAVRAVRAGGEGGRAGEAVPGDGAGPGGAPGPGGAQLPR